MHEETIGVPIPQHIIVSECLSDLKVQGADEARIVVRVDGDEAPTLEREGETLTIRAPGSCQLVCPRGTTLAAHVVRGDLTIKGVQGPATIGDVNGDATLYAVGPVTLKHVFGDLSAENVTGHLQAQTVNGDVQARHVEGEISLNIVHGDVVLRSVGPALVEQASGDLSAKRVSGDLRAGRIQGDARIRHVDGLLTLEQVGSDLRAEGIHGGVAASEVGADVRLGPPFSPGAIYRVKAGGNVEIRLPDDASLRLSLQAGGGVRSHIADLTLHETGVETSGVIGAGEATLEAQAGGHITLRPSAAEGASEEEFHFDIDLGFLDALENLGPMIEARIAEAMANMEARLQEGLGRINGAQIRVHVDRAAEHARRAAERAAEQVRRQAEREAERARIRAERAERCWQRASGKRPRQEPVATDEERLRVLRMLEQGKITLEQANELLAALEGR